jgi:hypothetical protein
VDREPDQWTRKTPITFQELADLRKKAIEALDKTVGSPVSFTCDNCPWATVCTLVFDGYNTSGDCLWEK